MKDLRTFTTMALTSAVFLALPGALEAQIDDDMELDLDDDPSVERVDLRVRGGVALPAQELADYTQTGYHFGGGAALWLTDHVAVRADAELNGMRGEEQANPLPDMNLWHYGAGLELDMMGRESASPFTVQANVGGGATTLDTERFAVPGTGSPREDITRTYPQVNAGLEFGYAVTPNLETAIGSTAYLAFVDESDLDRLESLNPDTSPLDMATVFPITATVRVDVPNL